MTRISSSSPRVVFPARLPADLSHWRDRLELLLAESLRVAHEAGALRGQDLNRVTVEVASRLRQLYSRVPGPPRRWRAATPLLLKSRVGDAANVAHSAVGHNFRRILAGISLVPYPDRIAAISIQSALRSAS